MQKNIPTYRIVINPEDENSGVYAVSLVDTPAIEVDWIKLSKEVIDFEFSANTDKKLLYGPLLIPNKLIFRRDDKGNEFNIMFDEETIKIIADRFNENKYGDMLNFQHSDKKVNAFITENWIIENPDKSNKYGFDLPDGTWFSSVKVKDDNFWLSEVKSGNVKGFSVEIKCGVELIEMTSHLNEDQNINKSLMELKTKDGKALEIAEMKIDAEVFEVAADGVKNVPTDGDYQLETGEVISIVAGKIAEISSPTEEVADNEEEMADVVPAEVPAEAPTVDFESKVNDLITLVGELTARIDQLEANIASTEKVDDNTMLSKIEELEEKLSSIAGAKTIAIIDDRSEKIIEKEKMILERIVALKKQK